MLLIVARGDGVRGTRHCIGALRPRGGGSITPSMRSTGCRAASIIIIHSSSLVQPSAFTKTLASPLNLCPHHSRVALYTANSSTDW